MADVDALYKVTWGRLRLWCSTVTSNNGRTPVIHELATGDEHPVQDRGLAPRKTKLSLLFDDFPSEDDPPITRFRQLLDQIEGGGDQIFTHPVRGSYLVKVGEFDYDIDEDGNVSNCSLELIANQPIAAVQAAGAGTSPSAGSDAVNTRADALQAACDDAQLDTALPALAKGIQSNWDDIGDQGAGVPIRQVLSDAANVSQQVADFIEVAALEDDLDLWPVYQAAIFLGDAVRASSLAVTSSAAAVFVLTIRVPISVLALIINVYGGGDAADLETQIHQLNDLETIGGLIQPGDVVLPVAGASVEF